MRQSPNPQFPADLVTFTEEIFSVKLHFLCSRFFIIIISLIESFTYLKLSLPISLPYCWNFYSAYQLTFTCSKFPCQQGFE